jgi:PIN domain nuclease of toxin-antitoxin system
MTVRLDTRASYTDGRRTLAGSHPALHRDYFDRMLAAQAEMVHATLLTLNRTFGEFGRAVLW